MFEVGALVLWLSLFTLIPSLAKNSSLKGDRLSTLFDSHLTQKK
jgi:hypothetical protein